MRPKATEAGTKTPVVVVRESEVGRKGDTAEAKSITEPGAKTTAQPSATSTSNPLSNSATKSAVAASPGVPVTSAPSANIGPMPSPSMVTKSVANSTSGASLLGGAGKNQEKVPVELEWEQIAGAKLYELEFQDLTGHRITAFKSPSHIFKFKMKVGRYKVRSRVADERKVFGTWSTLNEFSVVPKPPYLGDKAVRTTAKLDPKTLTSEVIYHWGTAPGAEGFKLTIVDGNGAVVHEEVTTGYSYRAQLPAGEYSATLTALGPEGINSQPVAIPGKVMIQSARLSAPEILFEKESQLPMRGEVPLLRWKPRSRSVISGDLEYRYFFGDEWIPVQTFKKVTAQEVLLDKAMKPGRYRISMWAESVGLTTSAPTVYEFVIKPKSY